MTGSVHFGFIDVTEAQLASMLIFIITAIFGEPVWGEEYNLLFGYPLRYIIYISILGTMLTAWPRYAELGTTEGAGMNGATVANTSIISPFGPIAAVLIIGVQLAYRTELYSTYVILVFIR